ncbi:MAG: flippase [Caldilineaceae bacterium]|nr:flippase [Caldilineaceae bacterium]
MSVTTTPPTTLEKEAIEKEPLEKEKKSSGTRRQIRGSSLLLSGQFISKAINFAVQVLIVRYLTKSDYGAFAYALSLVALGESVATFGLDRAITRFVPIYHEQKDFNRLFGTILMVTGSMLTFGLTIILLLFSLQGYLHLWIDDQLAINLLLVLIFLSPIQAIDDLLVGLFAVFTSSRAIFFRKHVLAPGLKLTVVLLLIFGHSNVFFLAVGYVTAGLIGIGICTVLLWRSLRSEGLLAQFNRHTIIVPWREILVFTIPLLTSDLVYVVMNAMDAVMLEYFGNTADVAALRAVQPTAKLNQMVLTSFGVLFTPVAARLFARNDREGINNLYWQNAVWIAVASFPIFVLTFSLAQPITLFLYGEEYAQSALILALLSFSYYFNAALGQNGLTLKVFGIVRYLVVINIIAVVINLGVNLLLIPHYGALGATIGTAGTLVLHNLLKQAGLRMGTGINLFEWRYFRVYLIITLSAVGVFLVQWFTAAPAYVSVGLAILASLLVIRLNRQLLNVNQTFPELLRIPLMKYILGG